MLIDPMLNRANALRRFQERQKELRKEKDLETRRKMIVSAKTESDRLAQTASSSPKQTYVKLSFLLHNMEKYGVVPDSFEDQKEKEDAFLLWRKVLNVVEKCKSQMLEEEIEQCVNCLNALSTEYLLRELGKRLVPYETYQRMKPQRDRGWQQYRKAKTQIISIWVIIAIVADITFLIYSNQVGFEYAASVMIYWILAGCGIGAVTRLIWDKHLPKDLDKLEQTVLESFANAGLDEQAFWQTVKDRFGSIPTTEQMETIWIEQEGMIVEIFGKPTDHLEGESENIST